MILSRTIWLGTKNNYRVRMCIIMCTYCAVAFISITYNTLEKFEITHTWITKSIELQKYPN